MTSRLTTLDKRRLAALARESADALRDTHEAPSERVADAAWAQVDVELAAREGAKRYWRMVFFRACEGR